MLRLGLLFCSRAKGILPKVAMRNTKRFRFKSNMTPSKWIFFASTCLIALCLYIVFCVYPIIESIRLSFFDWNGYITVEPEFVKFAKYHEVLTDSLFWTSFKNDLLITAIKEVLICFLTVLFAVSLTRMRMKSGECAAYKFLFYVPNVLSVVIIGSVWRYILMPGKQGLLNALLSIFGKEVSRSWLIIYPIQSIGFVASWCGVGLFMLTMIAAIKQVPDELYEAATIDGAGEMKQLQYVTMPAVWLQLTFMVVSILYQSLGGNFAIVNCFVSMSNSPIADKVTVMGYYVYSKGSSDIGFSYAASVVMLALTSAISLSVKIAMDKLGEAI